MTAVLVVSCDGSWNGMPCRGALPVHRIQPGSPDLVNAAREQATAEGWLLSVDGDYCPAHARQVQR